MPWRGFRIHVILLSLVVGLSVFFGIRWIYNKFGTDVPLAEALSVHKAVQSYTIDRKRPVVRVVIQLGPTADLKETYRDLFELVRSFLGNRPFELQIKDNRDDKLERAYYYAQFAVYEAIRLGNFREMVRFIEEEAAKEGAKATVSLDQENVYIQLEDNDHYLYEIIPLRGPGAAAGS